MKDVKNGTDDRGDRHSAFGRLLTGALNARSASLGKDGRSALVPGEGCLDAETLAAWADDSLGREERTAAEAHAADCARCQALLAAMVRIAPAPAARKPLWRLPALGWLIPVTAAAAAIIIWVIVPGRAPLQRSDSAVSVAVPRAQSETAQSEIDRFAMADAPAAAAPPAQQEDATAHADGRTRAPDGSSRRNGQAAAPLGVRSASPVKQKAAALEERAKKAVDAEREAVDRKLAPSPDANARSQPAIVGGVAAVPERKAESSSPPPASVAENVTVETRASALAAATGTVIVSPDPASRWRIVPSGRGNPGSEGGAGILRRVGSPVGPGSVVQRSTDAGSTWQTQETGASLTLTAGASPSPSVCWLVGPAGTVLLSTDGRSWRRLAFPEAADLASVTATDDKTATVTTSDGRTFSTTDGGLTWVRSSP